MTQRNTMRDTLGDCVTKLEAVSNMTHNDTQYDVKWRNDMCH